MHHKYYKVFPPHILSAADNMREYADTPPLQEININSIMFEPVNSQVAKSGPLHLRGYAYSGGGRPVTRVEVSLDGTATWLQCKLQEQRMTDGGRQYAWTFWELDVDFDPATCKELVLRAWDAHCNTQPATHQWNYNGMMNNAYFRVKVMPAKAGGHEFVHPSTWMKTDPLNKTSGGANQTAAPAKAAGAVTDDLPPWDGKPAVRDADGKRQFNAREVALHNKKDDMWVIIDGNVYDVTSFLPRHPGGAEPIELYGGKDSTAEFDILHDRKVLRTHLGKSQHLGTVKDYKPQGDAAPRTAKGAQIARQKAGTQQGMNLMLMAIVGLVCALLGHFVPSLLK
jgi:nitrate reductase (NAD(P)H)